MRALKIPFAAATLASLAACATPPSSPTAAPGPNPADPAMAGRLFAETCMATAPQFAGLAAAMASYPMTQNAGTGTYYHNTQDLSVKRVGTGANGSCSIVLGSNASHADMASAFAGAIDATNPSDGTTITLQAAGQFNGRSILNARIDAQ